MRLPRPARLGLRARITLAFGLGALLLSTLLASVTWGLTRENLLNQRDNAAVERVLINARSLVGRLGEREVLDNLQGVSTPEGSTPGVWIRGNWISVNQGIFSSNDVNPELFDSVATGTPARMRYENSRGDSVLVVGVAIPSEEALYFESVSLSSLEDTLNGLGIVLVSAALVTTVFGFAVGYYASGRTLRPLAEVGAAAQAIAGGRLDTRLEAEQDPDLQPLAESFNAMAGALQDRIERDARFASEVSHELRSPLMTLTASIEVLENSRDELPERAQKAVDLLSHDIERFQQLVEDLLEMSRFDAGAVHLDLGEAFAGEMVERTVSALVGSRVPVTVAPEAGEAVVRVDRRRVGQVLANLLDNAQKYGDGASGVTVDVVDDHVEIAVEDRGPGVPEDERELIFDRFSRGSAGGRRGDDFGTGLGLALVREHLNLLGGQVRTEDRLDGAPGARFVVELPLVPLDDAADEGSEGPTLDAVPAEPPDEPGAEGAEAGGDVADVPGEPEREPA